MVKVYQAGDKWILGVDGGEYQDLLQEALAVILEKKPFPKRKWVTQTIIEKINRRKETWEYEHELWEFDGEEENIFTYEIRYARTKPNHAYLSGHMEFIIDEEYLKEKLKWWRENKNLTECEWHVNEKKWVITTKNYKDEDDLIEEE